MATKLKTFGRSALGMMMSFVIAGPALAQLDPSAVQSFLSEDSSTARVVRAGLIHPGNGQGGPGSTDTLPSVGASGASAVGGGAISSLTAPSALAFLSPSSLITGMLAPSSVRLMAGGDEGNINVCRRSIQGSNSSYPTNFTAFTIDMDPNLPGEQPSDVTYVTDIDDSGVAIGYYQHRTSGAAFTLRGFLRRANGEIVYLPQAPGNRSLVYGSVIPLAISRAPNSDVDGQFHYIVGSACSSCGHLTGQLNGPNLRPVVWRVGVNGAVAQMRELPRGTIGEFIPEGLSGEAVAIVGRRILLNYNVGNTTGVFVPAINDLNQCGTTGSGWNCQPEGSKELAIPEPWAFTSEILPTKVASAGQWYARALGGNGGSIVAGEVLAFTLPGYAPLTKVGFMGRLEPAGSGLRVWNTRPIFGQNEGSRGRTVTRVNSTGAIVLGGTNVERGAQRALCERGAEGPLLRNYLRPGLPSECYDVFMEEAVPFEAAASVMDLGGCGSAVCPPSSPQPTLDELPDQRGWSVFQGQNVFYSQLKAIAGNGTMTGQVHFGEIDPRGNTNEPFPYLSAYITGSCMREPQTVEAYLAEMPRSLTIDNAQNQWQLIDAPAITRSATRIAGAAVCVQDTGTYYENHRIWGYIAKIN